MSLTKNDNNQEFIADKSTETKNVPQKMEKQIINESPSNFNPVIKNFSPLDSQGNVCEEKNELKFFGVSEFYVKEISEELISKYGNYFLKSFDQKNFDIPPPNFMERHKINPIIRTKMVNWMLEVFHSFKSNEETIFGAVAIMDKYIWKTEETLKSEDIHLIGIVSMYLSSKIYDHYPIQMSKMIHIVGHDLFDQRTIKEMEQKIIKTIDFEVMTPNSYEFIQFLLYDLYLNNKENIVKLQLKKTLDILENCSIWLAKLCNHFDKYSSVSPIFVSVACVLIAYDMMKANCKNMNDTMKKFFRDWLNFLYKNIAKTQEIKNEIEQIYKNIGMSYNGFQKMNLKNLSEYHELYFD